MLILNNVQTADDYTRETTLESPYGGRLVYLVANASAIARFRPIPEQVASAGSKAAEYGQELVLTPQSAFIDKIAGVKFRSAVAGVPARIVAQLTEPGDILPASGTPFAGTLAASGAVTGVAGVLAHQEFNADVASAAATEAAPLTVASITGDFDGTTPVVFEFFAPALGFPLTGNFGVSLWDMTAGTDLGRLLASSLATSASGFLAGSVADPATRRFTPAAGSRTYAARMWRTAGTFTVKAGTGGVGLYLPGYPLARADPSA